MKADELRHALDDLAGDTPSIDDALASVTGRAGRDRLRNRAAAVAVVAVVVASAAFGVIRHSSIPEHVIVRNPTASTIGKVADFSWTRVRSPQSLVARIVTVNGHTYAVGNYGYAASVQELGPDGTAIAGFRDNISHNLAAVTDLIGVRGALVAVGHDQNGAAAWRSTDNGATWHAVNVEQPPSEITTPATGTGNATPATLGRDEPASINRVLSAHGELYAIGLPAEWTGSTQCRRSVWTSTDGASFTLARAGVACGGTDAADGPAGIVSLASSQALIAGNPPVRISPERGLQINAIAGDDHGYVAVGGAASTPNTPVAGAIWWSPDGKSWTREIAVENPDPRGFEVFTAVAHAAYGWIAVGERSHPNAKTGGDAIVWTSTDGGHWTKFTRDNGTFEQDAEANGVGVTNDGFAIWGTANISGSFTAADPGHQSFVLWKGSSTPPSPPLGIVEGTMDEVGGPAPGIVRGIAGALVATTADGHRVTANIGSGGHFSTEAPPGSYTIVGRSPQYNSGQASCFARYEGGDELGDTIIVRANHVAHVQLICEVR